MSLAKSTLSADLASQFPNATSPDRIKISFFMSSICPRMARAAILKLMIFEDVQEHLFFERR